MTGIVNDNKFIPITEIGSDAHKEFLSKASEYELRFYMEFFDDGKHTEEMKLLDEECSRRAGDFNDHRNGGEWI